MLNVEGFGGGGQWVNKAFNHGDHVIAAALGGDCRRIVARIGLNVLHRWLMDFKRRCVGSQFEVRADGNHGVFVHDTGVCALDGGRVK